MAADAQAAPVLVRVREMTKEFVQGSRSLRVLEGIDLELHRGEMVAIIGASGAGKSTLLHCLGTLDLPTDGEILFDGVDIVSLSPPQLARFRNESILIVDNSSAIIGVPCESTADADINLYEAATWQGANQIDRSNVTGFGS